ncbi:MAG TPA: nuclear transport factor 2 family protein [Brevundimonas sp.]|nr:nuclear transport factor 2 family protein [Brevundimonas sp.]
MIASLMALSLLVQAPSSQEAEVAAVLDRLNEASTAADAAAYFSLFTPDARFIGTDATERWSLSQFRAFAEPYFARGRGWTYNASARVITIAPIECRCIAWFDEELENASYGQTRGSGVLRLTPDGWKIEQYVLSFAIPNERSDAVVAAIRAGE